MNMLLTSFLVFFFLPDQDGAEPSGNSVTAHNLVRLAGVLDRHDLREKAGTLLSAFTTRLTRIPIALPEMISAVMMYHESPVQVSVPLLCTLLLYNS